MRGRRHDRNKDLVGFRLGDVHYAVPIGTAREIINPLPLVPLRRSFVGVLGVADHRGEVVPVLDLRERFGLPQAPPTRKTKWVILGVEGQAVGLTVDAVTDVYGANRTDARELPRLGTKELLQGVAGVVRHRGELVFVLDVDKVTAPARAIDLEGAALEREGHA